MTEIIQVSSNIDITKQAGHEVKRSTHKQIIYLNHIYWWFRENKNSVRYVCKQKNCKKYKCTASLTLTKELDQVLNSNSNHNHNDMSETEIKEYLELQNLKISVESDSSVSIKNKYNIAQNNFD